MARSLRKPDKPDPLFLPLSHTCTASSAPDPAFADVHSGRSIYRPHKPCPYTLGKAAWLLALPLLSVGRTSSLNFSFTTSIVKQLPQELLNIAKLQSFVKRETNNKHSFI